MDEDKKTIEENVEETDLDTAFDSVPEEVQDFMNSDAYKFIINAIAKVLSLDDTQKELVRLVANEVLIRTMTQEEGFEFLIEHGVSNENAVKAMYAIDSEIVTRAANITEFYSDDIPVIPLDVDDNGTNVSPVIRDSLSSLSDRLKQATTAVPIARSGANASDSVSPSQDSGSAAIDPYKEPIDNE
ncbi:MAG TPA: hypothetical protein VL576_03780 [Candidatus Paceibacterota bacterium]|jgi:hypothetical protein|nr:hypothetical protein [Candidatus Paceibacterota bacterium]